MFSLILLTNIIWSVDYCYINLCKYEWRPNENIFQNNTTKETYLLPLCYVELNSLLSSVMVKWEQLLTKLGLVQEKYCKIVQWLKYACHNKSTFIYK